MGYESRIIVVDRHDQGHFVFAEKLAEIKMSKMGYGNGWREMFSKPVDYKLFIDSCNEDTDKDCYGEHLKSTNIQTVVDWLETEIQNGNKYRRLQVLLSLLKGFDESQWTELQVVHYGY